MFRSGLEYVYVMRADWWRGARWWVQEKGWKVQGEREGDVHREVRYGFCKRATTRTLCVSHLMSGEARILTRWFCK